MCQTAIASVSESKVPSNENGFIGMMNTCWWTPAES